MKLFGIPAGPARLGLTTSVGTAVAVLVMCLSFQIIVPARVTGSANYLGVANGNFRAIILYAAAGGCHTLVCLFSTAFLFLRLKSEEPAFEFSRILTALAVASVVIFFALGLVCYLNLAVVEQSYHDTVRPLINDSRFGLLVQRFEMPVLKTQLEPLAFVPLFFFILGTAFSIMACFWSSHRAVDFFRKANDLKKAEIVELKGEVAQLMTLLSIVFTSSCISTIAFLQLGRDWIEKGAARDTYIQNGYAVSIFWSACFTIIMLAIILIPLFWVGRKASRIKRQVKFSGKRAGLYDPFYDVFSYGFISKTGAATLMPIVTSSIATVIGS